MAVEFTDFHSHLQPNISADGNAHCGTNRATKFVSDKIADALSLTVAFSESYIKSEFEPYCHTDLGTNRVAQHASDGHSELSTI